MKCKQLLLSFKAIIMKCIVIHACKMFLTMNKSRSESWKKILFIKKNFKAQSQKVIFY